LDQVLTVTKARQLKATAWKLRTGMAKLCDRHPVADTIFVPIVTTPTESLRWNEVVHAATESRLLGLGTLGGQDILPPCLMSVRDLRILERLVEQGVDAGGLLARWRTRAPEEPFDHFVLSENLPLARPAWETMTFNRVIDELVKRMEAHQRSKAAD
jgi:hypothetical protein